MQEQFATAQRSATRGEKHIGDARSREQPERAQQWSRSGLRGRRGGEYRGRAKRVVVGDRGNTSGWIRVEGAAARRGPIERQA